MLLGHPSEMSVHQQLETHRRPRCSICRLVDSQREAFCDEVELRGEPNPWGLFQEVILLFQHSLLLLSHGPPVLHRKAGLTVILPSSGRLLPPSYPFGVATLGP